MSETVRVANFASYEESWRVCLLRAQDRAERPLGAGVLLPGGLVLTCAHSVLSRPAPDGSRDPLDTVYVDVPRAPLSRRVAPAPLPARVLREYLVPPTPHFSGDLALLKLSREPDVPHAVLHRQIPAHGEPVHFTGYPEDLPGGEHLDARLMGHGGPAPNPEWVQLDTHGAPYAVRHGYSGSGVVHSRSRRLIGIVAHQFGTPYAPVRREHAYMIPTETVLKYLPLERLGLRVTGARAVSRDIAVAADRTASGRVPGLHRRLTRWLDDAPDTERVELVFAGEGQHALLHTVRSTLTLADREQSPQSASGGLTGEPRAGSIDFAADATNRTVAELAAQAADRIGLESAPPRELLSRIAEKSPPLIAALLAVDRSASADAEVVALLRALLAHRHSRLLLVFSDPESPLLARVCDELLEPDWPDRRAERLAARLSGLTGTEHRGAQPPTGPPGAHPEPQRTIAERAARLHGTLQRLGRDGPLYGRPALPHALYRLAVDIEAALLEAECSQQVRSGPGGWDEFVVEPPGDGLTDLPAVTVRAPEAMVTASPDRQLAAGDLLHQQYTVVGPIGRGSHGQVYLARDLLLENRPVALKGILDPQDPAAVLRAHQERLRLVSLNHPAVIRVINYARHQPRAAEFIVMEFADGAPLEWVADRIAREEPPFAGPRVREFIVAYGLRVLDALGYLHEQEGLVYGDLSLTNVLHCGTGIKLIDVAGVREPGVAGPVTHRPPESGPAGDMTTAGDLFGVGAVLTELLDRIPEPPDDLGTRSLRHALRRATDDDPRRRYASAREMAVQLGGVLRELRSLRLGEEAFEPSPLFAPAATTLDGQLGKAPSLDRWRRGSDAGSGLGAPVPGPAEAAVALPVPKPDREDPNWKELQRTSYDDPAGLLQLSEEWLPSPELHLLRCRLQLELARHDGRAAARLVNASLEHQRAHRLLAAEGRAAYDWRLDWHQGLTHLAHGRVEQALAAFDEVYKAIPGEYAPKLALGYCHEYLAADARGSTTPGGPPPSASPQTPGSPAGRGRGGGRRAEPAAGRDGASKGRARTAAAREGSSEGRVGSSDAGRAERPTGRAGSSPEAAEPAAPPETVAGRAETPAGRSGTPARGAAEPSTGRTDVPDRRPPAGSPSSPAAEAGESHPAEERGARSGAGRPGRGAEAAEPPDPAVEAHEQRAMRYYDAVWRRNHAQGSAAFGLARIHLARGDPDAALASLDGVPADSRHRTAARTAMVRIHAGPRADGGPPTVRSIARAYAGLHRLASHEGLTDRQARERLTAELHERLLDLVVAAGEGRGPLAELRDPLPAATSVPATERELREQLSAVYRLLAKQVPRTGDPRHAALAEALLDNAYRTRPLGLRHYRDRRRVPWLAALRPARRTPDPGEEPESGGRRRTSEPDRAPEPAAGDDG
ncbi:tetratricopeptide repeat protein [Streptomyces sp. SAJ15]|uniref:tetratricopeptide repeat protein n=1 Tax=Streptomyces sp. SAJ15 TaxID=2011095 RepID=UPI001185D530|nr:tetratricopeptide repeat protein [Streptomyces sp. SAJ15]TVL91019.1 serine/threonine protein kinase [Streptomyces sp. SAJ15]